MDPLTQYGPGLTGGRREKTLSGLRSGKDKHYNKVFCIKDHRLWALTSSKRQGIKGAKHSSVDGFQVECDFCCPCF